MSRALWPVARTTAGVGTNPDDVATPFSMGVSRTGFGYVIYNDGQLYKVSMADASCEPTNWAPGQLGFNAFGMGYAIDDDVMGETLHVAEISFDKPSLGLGTIDTNTFVLEFGTHDPTQGVTVFRVDNWLHQHGDPTSALGERIRAEMRDFFFVDDEGWRSSVAEQGLAAIHATLDGIERGDLGAR